MPYFTQEFIDYLRQLARNTTRDFYQGHKAHFQQRVKGPFDDFVEELIHRVSALTPDVRHLEPKDWVFSAGSRCPVLQGQGADGLGTASGLYQPTKAQLHQIREARDDLASFVMRYYRAGRKVDDFLIDAVERGA